MLAEHIIPVRRRAVTLVMVSRLGTQATARRRWEPTKHSYCYMAWPGGESVAVTFDNDQKAAAPKDALRLMQIIND
jgi:hypothetical protein